MSNPARNSVPPSDPRHARDPGSTRAAEFEAEIALRILDGLALLLRANDSAADVGLDGWDFALEIGELRRAGLTRSDLRWLIQKDFVEHARDVTLPGEARRSFHPVSGLTFTRRSCLLLTDRGADFVRQLIGRAPAATAGNNAPGNAFLRVVDTPRLVPSWNRDLQELSFDGCLIKQFKVPAPNQEVVLSAFEEEGWPTRIDDPLSPQHDQDPKRRLHDTINSLNRNHRHRRLRFLGDGSGQGVRWTMEDKAES